MTPVPPPRRARRGGDEHRAPTMSDIDESTEPATEPTPDAPEPRPAPTPRTGRSAHSGCSSSPPSRCSPRSRRPRRARGARRRPRRHPGDARRVGQGTAGDRHRVTRRGRPTRTRTCASSTSTAVCSSCRRWPEPARPVVLNFWSSTCVPCLNEMPAIEQVHDELDGKVTVVGIDVTDTEDAGTAMVGQDRRHLPQRPGPAVGDLRRVRRHRPAAHRAHRRATARSWTPTPAS